MKPIMKPLIAAIAAASASSAFAVKYHVEATGILSTFFVEFSNTNSAPFPNGVANCPDWSLPILVCNPGDQFAGPGQGHSLDVDMTYDANADTLTLDDFVVLSTDRALSGNLVYTAGSGNRLDTANAAANIGSSCIEITSASSDTSPLTFTCGPTFGDEGWATDSIRPVRYVKCVTDAPNSTGMDNSCGPGWGGGTMAPAAAIGPWQMYENGASTGDTNNPALFSNANDEQDENTYNIRTAAFDQEGYEIDIHFTGSVGDSSFAITSIDLELDGRNTVNEADATTFKAFLDGSFVFDTVDTTAQVDSAKAVPAMGALGLFALFGGLVAVASRLRRRVG